MSFWRKKWFWFLVIVLGAGWWWFFGRDEETSPFVTAVVERGDVVQTVSVSATLVADAEIDLGFETVGRLKSVRVKGGDKVAEGDVLADIQSVTLSEEVRKAQAAVERAEAEAGLNDDTLREARQTVENARALLEDTEDAEDQKVNAADKAYENAKNYADAAESYYNQVVDDNGSDSSTAKSARLTLVQADNSKASAHESKETARQSRDLAIQSAKNSLRSAQERVKTLESSHQKTVENSALQVAQSNYQIALENLGKAQLKAPANGTVTKVNYDKGEVVGSAVTQPFGRLLSADLLLEADIPESDVAKVKLGQTAKVTFDALGSDEGFDADVVEIDPESTVIQDVVYYRAKLRLKSVDQRLKPGMSADADIRTAEKKNTLIVPSRALRQDGSQQYVEVVKADGANVERRNVKIGLEGDEGRTELVSGVQEGENLVVERVEN